MDVYWVHFIPESLYFRYLLSKIAPIYRWEISKVTSYEDVYTRLDLLFTDPFAGTNRPAFHPPVGLRNKMQALLLYLTGDMLESYSSSLTEKMDVELERLTPSINYMDDYFTENPSLAAVAGQSHLAPNYFHRVFSKKFGMTPLNYMIMRRMEYAQGLLGSTPLSIKETARACGYQNEFYFSRIFKNYLGISPSEFRRRERMA
jgi:AraC-like DNA-binding protein